jgi:HK97 family phage portal protein
MPESAPLPGYEQTSGGILLPTELRAASATSDLRNPTAWLSNWALGGYRNTSGAFVSQQGLLGLAAYYGCIRAISEDVAKLPLPVYQEIDDDRFKRRSHWLARLLNRQMNDDMSAFDARRVMMFHVLGWGDAYGLILRDRSMVPGRDGQPTGIYPLHPACVRPRRDPVTGEVSYDVRQPGQAFETVPDEDMLHLKGLSQDGLCGMSIVQIAAQSMGLSIAAQDYGASYFGNAMSPGGMLKSPVAMSDPAKANLRKSMEAFRGAENAGKFLLLEEGLEYQQLMIPPEQAQYIVTRKFQTEEIARWFRFPLTKLGVLENAHYANMEQEGRAYVTDTLGAYFVSWEQEIQIKLLGVESDYYVKHNANALMRGDSAAQAEFYRTMVTNGIYSPNDVLSLEDMNGYEGGDEHFLQLNMAPVRKIVDGTARQPARPRVGPVSPGDPTQAHRNGHVPAGAGYAP